MIKILARIFIRNSQNFSDSEVRSKYGVLCGAVGIFFNFLLFSSKLVAGIFFSSVAVIADAFNNLSDAATSLIQLLGFKLSLKEPDAEHPFGHGRIEYIAGLIISFIILLMGFELFRTSLFSIFPRLADFNFFDSHSSSEFSGNAPADVDSSFGLLFVLAGSIAVKFYMFVYNFLIAKKIDSASMRAAAKDSLSDTFSTFVVIISVLLSPLTDFPIDALAGCVVSCFILYTGFDSARETVALLLGKAPSEELVDRIEEELLKHPPITAMHDLIVHDYGPGRRMISLHAEVPGDDDIFELHEAIDGAESAIARKIGCSVVIHMDPVDVNDPHLAEIKSFLSDLISRIDSALTVHDVRIVGGYKKGSLLFDVVKPFGLDIVDGELKKMISSAVRKSYPQLRCLITVESPFLR